MCVYEYLVKFHNLLTNAYTISVYILILNVTQWPEMWLENEKQKQLTKFACEHKQVAMRKVGSIKISSLFCSLVSLFLAEMRAP